MATFHLTVKSGKRGKAFNHAAYITRVGKHGTNDKAADLVLVKAGNLPGWAEGDPARFWRETDQHERANGSAYTEFEMALPAELTRQQQIELVDTFAISVLKGKPYQLAVHEPEAALGKTKQPHVHLMFNNRVPDGIERTSVQHFRRFNPEYPERGGCKKESGGLPPIQLRQQITATRALWAKLQNDALEKHGHEARVDHRSLKDQGLTREPERHLGQARIRSLSEDEQEAFVAKRNA